MEDEIEIVPGDSPNHLKRKTTRPRKSVSASASLKDDAKAMHQSPKPRRLSSGGSTMKDEVN